MREIERVVSRPDKKVKENNRTNWKQETCIPFKLYNNFSTFKTDNSLSKELLPLSLDKRTKRMNQYKTNLILTFVGFRAQLKDLGCAAGSPDHMLTAAWHV